MPPKRNYTPEERRRMARSGYESRHPPSHKLAMYIAMEREKHKQAVRYFRYMTGYRSELEEWERFRSLYNVFLKDNLNYLDLKGQREFWNRDHPGREFPMPAYYDSRYSEGTGSYGEFLRNYPHVAEFKMRDPFDERRYPRPTRLRKDSIFKVFQYGSPTHVLAANMNDHLITEEAYEAYING